MQDATATQNDTRGPLGPEGARIVRHMRHIMLWPVYLNPLPDDAPVDNHFELLRSDAPDSPWRQIDDEFGDPSEFQERHYNEFVTFLPPVQRFLYGQGLGKAVRQIYGESPIKVLRRNDITRVRLTLDKDDTPVEFEIKHIDVYFYFDIDVALLTIEIAANDVPIDVAQKSLFRMGRAYPAYWENDGSGGHCPWACEWLDAAGEVLARSDYENRDKFLSFVCQHRAPAVASHWQYLLSPFVLHHSDAKGFGRFRQLEYYRMPYMAFLAFDNPGELTRADHVRFGLGAEPGVGAELPYSQSYLAEFEDRFVYDRYCHTGPEIASGMSGTRFLATGHTLLVIGDAQDPFFMHANGFLGRFRHQHFLLFMVAHFQKAALRMFSDRLVAIVSALDVKDLEAKSVFRRDIRLALENFLRFEHRYWFHEISNQAQARELFQMTQRHLELDALHHEVRQELHDMSEFLDVEAMRRQNETVVRLTVVTIFGLIGTIVTGFLGMNIIAWAEQPAYWRIAAFLLVLVPTALLTLFMVMRSRRLSEFLDTLSDETLPTSQKLKALGRVWRRPSQG
jgi:hypothetical protein